MAESSISGSFLKSRQEDTPPLGLNVGELDVSPTLIKLTEGILADVPQTDFGLPDNVGGYWIGQQ